MGYYYGNNEIRIIIAIYNENHVSREGFEEILASAVLSNYEQLTYQSYESWILMNYQVKLSILLAILLRIDWEWYSKMIDITDSIVGCIICTAVGLTI